MLRMCVSRYYDETIVGHRCKLCRIRIRYGYSCRQCKFDLCMSKWKKAFDISSAAVLGGRAIGAYRPYMIHTYT